jgi:hypothetical protein
MGGRLSRTFRPGRKQQQPRKQKMGSTPDGNAAPTLIGTALPQEIKIGRAGICRVGLVVAPG